MKKFIEGVKFIDIFSQPFNLRVQNKASIKSISGGMATILMICILFFFGFLFGDDIYLKKKPNLINTIDILEYYPFLNFTDKNSLISVRIEDLNGYPLFEYTKYFDIAIYHYRSKIIDGGYNNTITPLKFEKCDKNSNLSYLFKNLDIETFHCIKDFNVDLGGYYSNEFVNYISISVNLCDNKTSNNSCSTPELIESKIFDYNFNLYYSDTIVNPRNYENPFILKLNNFYTNFELNFSKSSSKFYSIVEIETDSGFLFKSPQKINGTYISEKYDDVSLRRGDDYLILYDLYLNNKKQRITRSYIKIQDISAQLGGILQLLIIFFQTILFPLQNKKLDLILINNLFKFSDKELDLKLERNIVKKIRCEVKAEMKCLQFKSPTKLTNSPKKFTSEIAQAVPNTHEKFDSDLLKQIITHIKGYKDFKYSKCEIIISSYFCCKKFYSNSLINKDMLLEKCRIHLNKLTNVDILFEKILEIDVLKYLLFNKKQILSFNFLEKPVVCIDEMNIKSKFSRVFDKIKDDKIEILSELINYFKKFDKQDLKKPNDLNSRFFGLLNENVRDLILAMKEIDQIN